jgi:hypothetical protein
MAHGRSCFGYDDVDFESLGVNSARVRNMRLDLPVHLGGGGIPRQSWRTKRKLQILASLKTPTVTASTSRSFGEDKAPT